MIRIKRTLAHFLNDHGIRNRKGETWHDATIGAILHNPLYKGILRSGETYSEPFEELQIIKPELFDMAQALMNERTNEQKEYRTMPLNTTGQSLLSGNVFCGHCGGRLTLTTNGKVYRQADGTCLKKKRIRYVCYNKTRHRVECDGQTGYTMHSVILLCVAGGYKNDDFRFLKSHRCKMGAKEIPYCNNGFFLLPSCGR